MTTVLIQEQASRRLDEIYRYTVSQWGTAGAERYIRGIFKSFDRIATHDVLSCPIPAEFGVQGYFYKYERHFVYWKKLTSGAIGIVTILHERMHQMERFKSDYS